MLGRMALLGANNSTVTPMQMPKTLWLDASDNSSVITVSGAVSQWSDKSGNSRHVYQATANYRPAYVTAGLNEINVISFNGSSGQLSLASNLSIGTSYSIYVVVKNNNTITSPASFNDQAILYCPSPITFLNTGNSASAVTGELLYFGDTSLSAGSNGYAKSGISIAPQTFLIALRKSSGFSGRFTGADDFTTTVNGGLDPTVAMTLRNIGSYDAISSVFNGLMCEIIIFPTSQSLSDTQYTEGYLAWKWGFQLSLPVDHPYRSAPPT